MAFSDYEDAVDFLQEALKNENSMISVSRKSLSTIVRSLLQVSEAEEEYLILVHLVCKFVLTKVYVQDDHYHFPWIEEYTRSVHKNCLRISNDGFYNLRVCAILDKYNVL